MAKRRITVDFDDEIIDSQKLCNMIVAIDSDDMLEITLQPAGAIIVDKIVIHTDGGCDHKNGQIGAWAYHIEIPGKPTVEMAEACWDTTVNKMELMAVIKALEATEIGQEIVVYSDSQYVVKGITTWVNKWVRNGWKTSDPSPKPVANRDLWEKLLQLRNMHTVNFVHIPGHSGVYGNERCDTLCTMAMQALIKADKET